MNIPALKTFLDDAGKIVHHLNTVAVGLAAVEAGAATRPDGMDISWTPKDPVASGRQARSFVLRTVIVTVAEQLVAFLLTFSRYPGIDIDLSKVGDRSEKLEAVARHFLLAESHLFLGPLLLIHWRNRVIHHSSNASLTKEQQEKLTEHAPLLAEEYKNLDPCLLLNHFYKNSPTLKDVSSLVAMTINLVKKLSSNVPEPTSSAEVRGWIEHLSLAHDLDRVERVGAAKGKRWKTVYIFLSTNCPELIEPYKLYIENIPGAE